MYQLVGLMVNSNNDHHGTLLTFEGIREGARNDTDHRRLYAEQTKMGTPSCPLTSKPCCFRYDVSSRMGHNWSNYGIWGLLQDWFRREYYFQRLDRAVPNLILHLWGRILSKSTTQRHFHNNNLIATGRAGAISQPGDRWRGCAEPTVSSYKL